MQRVADRDGGAITALLLRRRGGLAGASLGVVVVYGYAAAQGWPVTVPVRWAVTGPAVAVVAATVAGLYPALRASRMSPTGALRSA